MTYKLGLWTPWAQVLCLDCHGPTIKRAFGGPDKVLDPKDFEAEELEENELSLTVCDKCGGEIALRGDISEEHRLMRALKDAGLDASMAQTGGMCSAVQVNRPDGSWIWASVEVPGEIYIGFYANEDDEVGHTLGSKESYTYEEALGLLSDRAATDAAAVEIAKGTERSALACPECGKRTDDAGDCGYCVQCGERLCIHGDICGEEAQNA